jgi:DNA-binding transcriptional ArsR family regulator
MQRMRGSRVKGAVVGPPDGVRPALTAEAMELVAGRFRVLSDVTRLRMLQLLESGENSVSAIAEALASTQPNISKHLRILQDTGLVSRRQDGNTVYYAIADPTVFAICDIVCSSLAARYSNHASSLRTKRRRSR